MLNNLRIHNFYNGIFHLYEIMKMYKMYTKKWAYLISAVMLFGLKESLSSSTFFLCINKANTSEAKWLIWNKNTNC